MTGKFVTLTLVLLIAMMAVCLESTPAAAISCLGAGDVTQLGAAGCTMGGLTFSDFTVSATGVEAKIFLSPLSTSIGQDVNLDFQITHDPSPTSLSDIVFGYKVQAGDGNGLDGVDLFNPGQNVTIHEVACASPFTNGLCSSNPLADLLVPPNSVLASNFAATPIIFLRKDIQFGENAFISEFTESHDVAGVPLESPAPAPEPATLLLLGTTLAGLAMAARRK